VWVFLVVGGEGWGERRIVTEVGGESEVVGEGPV